MTVLVTLSDGTNTFGFRESQVLSLETNQRRTVAQLETVKGSWRSQLLGYQLKRAQIKARFHKDDYSEPPTSPESQLSGLQFLYDMESAVFTLNIDTKNLGTYIFENLDIIYTKVNGSEIIAADVTVDLIEHSVAP